jgi:hypothetical protein
MNFFKTLIFYEHKVKKLWKFECFLDMFNSTLLLYKKGWNKLYYEN